MSLVAYGSSDEDSEPEIDNTIPVQKKREPIKISIPSLKEFKEEEPKEVTKPKPKGGSGLFSLLPPPKNSGILSKPGFTPYIFSKKKTTESKTQLGKKNKPITTVKSTFNTSNSVEVEYDSIIEEDSKESTEKVDFFSLGTDSATKDSASNFNQHETSSTLPSQHVTFDNITSTTTEHFLPETTSEIHVSPADFSLASGSNFNYVENEVTVPVADNPISSNWNFTSSDTINNSELQSDFLKDEKFLKLSGKHKEEINIIDVNAEDQLVEKDEWLRRSLTEEKIHMPSKRRCDMPTSQQKRKHQITYLAFQAKEREMDLKNQWAHNSRTRRETQAKYGF